MKILKAILQLLLPSSTYNKIRVTFRKYGFTGDYPNWESALKKSCGYNDPSILDKVVDSSLAVQSGKACFERDGILFYEREYNYPLMTILLSLALKQKGKVTVLDFGGALGGTSAQHLPLLREIDDWKWMVVEQPHFVEIGNRHFASENLQFYLTIAEALKKRSADLLLLSSVVQYLPEPWALLKHILEYHFKIVVIHRTPISREGRDRLTVQKVPPQIYNASYPAWLLSHDSLVTIMEHDYNLLYTYADESDENDPLFQLRGYVWQRKGQ